MAMTTAVEQHSEFTLFAFDLGEDPATPDMLKAVALPGQTEAPRQTGLVISGRGPVWLFARLVHLAHDFAWVATHDPRLGGAVVVERHVPSAPEVGSVVPFENR